MTHPRDLPYGQEGLRLVWHKGRWRRREALSGRENGGYFVFRRELLGRLDRGADLVGDTLTGLAAEGKVICYDYDGFWLPADTVKERVALDRIARHHPAPWEVWKHQPDPLSAPLPPTLATQRAMRATG